MMRYWFCERVPQNNTVLETFIEFPYNLNIPLVLVLLSPAMNTVKRLFEVNKMDTQINDNPESKSFNYG